MSAKAMIHGRESMRVLRAFMQYHRVRRAPPNGAAVAYCGMRIVDNRARLPARGRYEIADPVFADAA